jgi:hypothetical protein
LPTWGILAPQKRKFGDFLGFLGVGGILKVCLRRAFLVKYYKKHETFGVPKLILAYIYSSYLRVSIFWAEFYVFVGNFRYFWDY